jgi:hypothetical protein
MIFSNGKVCGLGNFQSSSCRKVPAQVLDFARVSPHATGVQQSNVARTFILAFASLRARIVVSSSPPIRRVTMHRNIFALTFVFICGIALTPAHSQVYKFSDLPGPSMTPYAINDAGSAPGASAKSYSSCRCLRAFWYSPKCTAHLRISAQL